MAWHDNFTQFESDNLSHTTATFWNSVFQEALDNDKYLKDDLGTDELTTEAQTVHCAINEHEEQINVLNDTNQSYSITDADCGNGWTISTGSNHKAYKNGDQYTVEFVAQNGTQTSGTLICTTSILPAVGKYIAVYNPTTFETLGRAFWARAGAITLGTTITATSILIRG